MVTANVHGNREVKDKLRHFFSTGGFILVSDYVRMEVTLVGSWWDVVAGDQTGVDFIPMKFCGVPSRLALGVGALSGRGAGALQRHASA